MENEKSIRPFYNDINLLFFFLNAALVILSYGLHYFGLFDLIKGIRYVVFILSILILFFGPKKIRYFFTGRKIFPLYIFVFINLVLILFSTDFFHSLYRIFILLPFLFYINFFLIYLYKQYDQELIKRHLLIIFSIVYFIPLIFFFFSTEMLVPQNIRDTIIGGFKSNTYGWATVIFITISFDMITNKIISKYLRIVLIILCILAFYVLVSSGSRSAYLCMGVVTIVFLIVNKNINLFLKIISVYLIVTTIYSIYSEEDSALHIRITKTEEQLEEGDPRSFALKFAAETFTRQPIYNLIGVGFENFETGLNKITNYEFADTFLRHPHNSYLEIYFTTGIVSFLVFLIFIVFKSIRNYLKLDVKKYLFLVPIMIIPFFETEFNPGQFLFFPWFTFMFYYLHSDERQIELSEILNEHK